MATQFIFAFVVRVDRRKRDCLTSLISLVPDLNDSVQERCPSYPFSVLVEVYCDVVTGVLEISSNGEHGTKGQNGGDGVPGVRPPPVRNILATFYHNAYHFTNSGEIL